MTGLPDEVVGRLARGLALPTLPERYVPLEVIGRGAMGVVWRTEDRLLEREVAVKVLAEHVVGAEFASRMEREARLLAGMDHPGIVAVHDAGVLPDGRAWYAMRLVRGQPLAATTLALGTSEAVRIVARLTETLAYAHACGAVHGDLSPRNVMIGPYGEVLVLDWGSGAGTPGFMAPEQDAGRTDVRSDVYGLGAILGFLLGAGRVPRPLAAIRDCALAPEPASRYADATALLDDLRRFQDGRPVYALPERWRDTVVRLARQHRTALLLIAAYVVMRVAILLWRGI